jgi:hypothetical protein
MREDSMGKRTFDLLATPITTCLVLAVGLLLSNPKTEWLVSVLIVAIVVTMSGIASLLLSRYFLGHIEHVISERLAEVTSVALMRPDGVGEFWTQEKVSKLERGIDVEMIWIVGRDFASEIAEDSPFLDVVKYNVHDQRITYVYIAPDTEVPRFQLNALRRAVGVEEDNKSLQILLLDDTRWRRLPYTAGNVTIYDPHSSRRPPMGYFWYPGLDGKSFGRLGNDVAVTWAAQIEEVCPEIDDRRGDGEPDASNKEDS